MIERGAFWVENTKKKHATLDHFEEIYKLEHLVGFYCNRRYVIRILGFLNCIDNT